MWDLYDEINMWKKKGSKLDPDIETVGLLLADDQATGLTYFTSFDVIVEDIKRITGGMKV